MSRPVFADIVGSTAVSSDTPRSSSPSNPPPPGVTIRTAESTPRDIERIASLGRHVFYQTFAASTGAEDLERYLNEAYSPAAIRADIENPDKRVIVAEAAIVAPQDETPYSPTLAGFAMIAINSSEDCLKSWEKPLELQRIYVDSAHQGAGVARKLEAYVTQWAREEGYKSVWLGVWENNHRAKAFYAKCGYEKIGTHDFVVGNQVDTDEIMAKSIEA